jgi:hypothetical protein
MAGLFATVLAIIAPAGGALAEDLGANSLTFPRDSAREGIGSPQSALERDSENAPTSPIESDNCDVMTSNANLFVGA